MTGQSLRGTLLAFVLSLTRVVVVVDNPADGCEQANQPTTAELSGMVEATLAASDEPARGTTVTVTSGADLLAENEPVDEHGRFRIHVATGNPPTLVNVSVAHPELISLEASRSWNAEGTDGRSLKFELAQKARLRGRVVDKDGNGLAGVRVGVYANGRYATTRGFTSEEGLYETDAPEGRLQLKVLSGLGFEGIDDESVSITAASGQPNKAPDLHAKATSDSLV